MSAPPAHGLGLALDKEPYSLLLQLHLGLPIVTADVAGRPCPTCGGAVRGVVPQLQVLQAISADLPPWWADAPPPPHVLDEAGNVLDAH